MASLYELTGGVKDLWDMLDEPDAPIEAILETLDIAEEDYQNKADNYARLIKSSQAIGEAIKKEKARLSKRQKVYENFTDELEKRLEESMKSLNIRKFKTNIFSYGIQKNAPSLNILTEEYIPKKYYIEQAPVLDRLKLLNDIKAGEIIEGVEIKQTESLRIR